jgi:protein-S-isoprenylcysteine O-methyltransferase Ste14
VSLTGKVVFQIIAGVLALGCVFFLTAGTLRYWQGWALMAAWFIPGAYFFLCFCKRDPELVRRRMQRKEKVKEQKVFMKVIYGIIYIGFLIPGLDFRLGWTKRWLGAVPLWLEIAALATVFGAYLAIIRVFDANRFAARTIQVEAEQKVVSKGPYKWVRHPMYLASLIMFLSVPLALGSYVALPVFALSVPMYVLRLLNEEQVLRKELPGYTEYCQATPYRLVPHVW